MKIRTLIAAVLCSLPAMGQTPVGGHVPLIRADRSDGVTAPMLRPQEDRSYATSYRQLQQELAREDSLKAAKQKRKEGRVSKRKARRQERQ